MANSKGEKKQLLNLFHKSILDENSIPIEWMNKYTEYNGLMSEGVGLQPKSLSPTDTDESNISEGQRSCGKSFTKGHVYKYSSLSITKEEKVIVGYVIWSEIKQKYLH